MSDKREAIIERLRKVLALAKGGVGGERENAERQLDSMLRKHGLTMADIDDTQIERVRVEFKYKNPFEERLFVQIVCTVLDTFDPVIYSYRKTRSRFHVYMKPAEKMLADYMVEVLKPALEKELKAAYTAFLICNSLFPATSRKDSDRELTDNDRKALQMAGLMDRTPIHKAIGVEK